MWIDLLLSHTSIHCITKYKPYTNKDFLLSRDLLFPDNLLILVVSSVECNRRFLRAHHIVHALSIAFLHFMKISAIYRSQRPQRLPLRLRQSAGPGDVHALIGLLVE
jgi:hypothetical protein